MYVAQDLSEDGRQWLLANSGVLHSVVAASERGYTNRAMRMILLLLGPYGVVGRLATYIY